MTNKDMIDEQAQMDRFFSRLGHAISGWAYIDRSLFELCKYAINTNENKMAVIFYRSLQIGDHLRLADELLNLSLSHKNIVKWKGLSKRIDGLLPFRNFIAHEPSMPVTHVVVTLGSDEEPTRYTDWSIQTEPRKLKRVKQKHKAVSDEDLFNHITDVNKLIEDLHSFDVNFRSDL